MVEGRCRNRIYHQVTKDFFKAAFDGLCCISFNIRDTRKKEGGWFWVGGIND